MVEDFELAKSLRDQIDALKRAGSELAELERQKASAIQEENYDEAKRIKMMIDQMRNLAINPRQTQQQFSRAEGGP